MLETVAGLDAAAELYLRVGFVLTHENPVSQWGAELVEQVYELRL
jgi:hypothetical protein